MLKDMITKIIWNINVMSFDYKLFSIYLTILVALLFLQNYINLVFYSIFIVAVIFVIIVFSIHHKIKKHWSAPRFNLFRFVEIVMPLIFVYCFLIYFLPLLFDPYSKYFEHYTWYTIVYSLIAFAILESINLVQNKEYDLSEPSKEKQQMLENNTKK